MKKFKYDVLELISCVRERPCLWDKSLENYKDRLERRAAWEEIFVILEPRYEDMTAEDRRLLGEEVIYKWTNIRDTFMKSLKTKLGKPKRRYMLHDQLIFLKNNLPEEERQEVEETPFLKQEESIEIEVPLPPPVPKKTRKCDDNAKGLRKRSKRQEAKRQEYEEVPSPKGKDLSEDIDYNEESDPRVMNEDEAFFASLLPTVVKYDEDDKLEFRMGVLAVMKKIRDSKKWTIDSIED
ncbi:uncharacterized protein LOC106135239 [Amyelois transitella]|uniref:uncharacterized protein LOC106135239 n=1 Tax=Amyelois transitella TaxID=680683 RepID=UPI00067AB7C2|nr:uncharacterized protein LOC106135239 [Amyelois transitella]